MDEKGGRQEWKRRIGKKRQTKKERIEVWDVGPKVGQGQTLAP